MAPSTLPQLDTSNMLPTIDATSPPISGASSPRTIAERRHSRSPLSIDLNNIPALQQPSPPSNTLLITQLTDPLIFHPASLATIRQHVVDLSQNTLFSFSPLKSLRRIIVTFYSTEAAIAVRQELDGKAFLHDVRARCYFGHETRIDEETKYLQKPDAGKLFFISPPPSPPIGWESKEEDAPNTQTHAEDLADALAKLGGRLTAIDTDVKMDDGDSPVEPSPAAQLTREELIALKQNNSAQGRSPGTGRSRSSTLIFDPHQHSINKKGDSPNLPAVMLEDTSVVDQEAEPTLDSGKTIIAHTSRPPVELMDQS